MSVEAARHKTRPQPEDVSERERSRFLSSLYAAYVGQGEKTTSAIARRAGLSETRVSAVKRMLRDRNMIYSVGYGDHASWRFTDAGWQEIGVAKPFWVED